MEDNDEGVSERVEKEVFEPYQCTSLAFGCPHPGHVSESGLLASVPLPPITYPHEAFAGAVIDECKLSQLQLEGVLCACQRHLKRFPDNTRAGFFLADGAGVGKGRQIAGIVLDNVARGRSKHVWVSISADLRLEAQRDLEAVGCHINVIDGPRMLETVAAKALGMASDFKKGCVFCTYATLARSTRLGQLARWCGGDEFDGCIVFDEAHKAKNFNDANEDSSSKISKAVVELQRLLPNARVVYCSATGVTDIRNLAYASRLGLWGAHSAFPDFAAFKECMERRGLGALELMAMELKASGAYVSRGLSWQGAEFRTSRVELSAADVGVYDTAAQLWLDLHKALARAIDLTHRSKRALREFWSAAQRFFKELANAFKVEYVVQRALDAVQNGQSVVIGLQSTGESGLEKAMGVLGKQVNDTVRSLVSCAQFSLVHLIQESFPTTIEAKEVQVMSLEEIHDLVAASAAKCLEQGFSYNTEAATNVLLQQREEALALANQSKEPVEVEECVRMKNALLERAQALELPPSPLDALIDGLGGPSQVAEMTGRRARVVRCAKSGKLVYEQRGDNAECDRINVSERNGFMEGRKHIAIISDAASTGISLHAAVGSANANRRRLHITFELPWSADKAIQQLGRSHRSHQSSAPVYELLVTNLGGEVRFAAAVANRLTSLGALTKGDRRAATGQDFSSFNVDSKSGREALRGLYSAAMSGVVMPLVDDRSLWELADSKADAPPSQPMRSRQAFVDAVKLCLEDMDVDTKTANVRVFLNRIQVLPVPRQNLMFAYFSRCLGALVDDAKANGTYDDGVADLHGGSISLQMQMKCGPPHRELVVSYVVVDRGMTWEAAEHRRAAIAQQGPRDGFYVSRRVHNATKEFLVLLALSAPAPDTFAICRPNTGASVREMGLLELNAKYERIPDSDLHQARKLWEDRLASSEGFDRGGRQVRLAVLSGCVLDHWRAMENLVQSSSSSSTRAERSLKACRCTFEDGTRIVGVRVPESVVNDLVTLLSMPISRSQVPLAALPLADEPNRDIVEEHVTPIDAKALKRATTPARTLISFFSQPAAPKRARDDHQPAHAAPLPSVQAKRPKYSAPPRPLPKRAQDTKKKKGKGKGEGRSGGATLKDLLDKKKVQAIVIE